jgi:hypothetical protein
MSPAQQQLFFASGKLLTMSQASRLTPYSAEYLGLLARRGKLKAIKFSRDWLTTEAIVLAYVKKQKAKHGKLMENFERAERSLA